MSAATRAAIAAAASTVEPVKCTPYFRQTTKPGDGMVRLERQERDDSGLGFLATWQVLIVLPQDVATAEKWLDTNAPALVDALSEVLIVTTVEPRELAPETGGRIPVVVITGIREQE